MKNKPIALKVGTDMFAEQMSWTAWFIGITFFIHLVKIFGNLLGTRLDAGGINDYFVASHVSGNVYMLVIGIIAAYAFLPFFVQNGVTRKDVFKGSMLGAIGLSLALPIITFILNQFVILFLDLANVSFAFTEMPNFVDEDAKEHILAGIIFSIIDAPFVSHNPVLSIVLNALNLLFFYVIGYFITSGFYRFNWMVGFGYIVMSLGLIALRALLWGSETMELLYNWLPIGEIQLSTVGFMFASIILSVFIMVLIRLTTKRVTIRM